MLARFVYAFLTIFTVFTALPSAEAEIAACDLVDKTTASQIIGRPVASGPRASKYVLADKVKMNCDFGAEGAPIAVVTVVLSEFKSPSEAKAWADQAKTSRDSGGRIETENMVSNEAVWWSQQHAAGYVVRKGIGVLEVYIRGAAAGAQPFQITSAMRPRLRQAVLHAIEKL
jgi:hypothetical protein